MKKIDGVADAEVSLTKGLATIKLNPGNKVRFEQVRKAVESRGVTPKDATVKLSGQLGFDNGRFRVAVAGTNESFEVATIASTPDKSEQALKQFIDQQLSFVVIIPAIEGKAQPAITIKDFWK